ncbi:hypothetical protein [Meiothermus granaticius]|uniref:Uncharacterized protein n=1 Tax=Meiothermus granaticius NBRC 107808 TaxID=1227551 RepID=A0A399FFN5_9DEIN|nr:hypothetical protein [Meiothermus granaticius]MCL6527794.1 hypothetical protein [Thermaceae bacterium]RIH94031.1 hypothetical protein Mgrana_00118 [Meiothermus granaticius NBRC 107808]GEM88485.1 hypothetical protein MGR01S_31100 [Meiothermus granaticius NBRC 107808]
MEVAGIFLAVLLLIVVLGGFNYLAGRRTEKAQQEWFRRVLGEGVSLEEFLKTAPYTYRPLAGRGYGILKRETGEEVWRSPTPEEAEAWIVMQTLAERSGPTEQEGRGS